MPRRTQTEYSGDVPTGNSVQGLGPNDRPLETHERLRLGYLTGQVDDPDAAAMPGHFYGVDPEYPDLDVE